MWAKTATVYINSPFLGTQQRCPITSILGRQQSNITKPLPWKNYCLIAHTKEFIFCHLQWKKLDQEAGSYIKCIFLLFLSYFFFHLLCHIINLLKWLTLHSGFMSPSTATDEDGFPYPLATGLEKKNFRQFSKKIQIFFCSHDLKNKLQEQRS